jgi:Holliday junction resolvasome RuvABC DNA-binding subunit
LGFGSTPNRTFWTSGLFSTSTHLISIGKKTAEEIAAELKPKFPLYERGTADGYGVRRHAAVARGDQREHRVPGAGEALNVCGEIRSPFSEM